MALARVWFAVKRDYYWLDLPWTWIHTQTSMQRSYQILSVRLINSKSHSRRNWRHLAHVYHAPQFFELTTRIAGFLRLLETSHTTAAWQRFCRSVGWSPWQRTRVPGGSCQGCQGIAQHRVRKSGQSTESARRASSATAGTDQSALWRCPRRQPVKWRAVWTGKQTAASRLEICPFNVCGTVVNGCWLLR